MRSLAPRRPVPGNRPAATSPLIPQRARAGECGHTIVPFHAFAEFPYGTSANGRWAQRPQDMSIALADAARQRFSREKRACPTDISTRRGKTRRCRQGRMQQASDTGTSTPPGELLDLPHRYATGRGRGAQTVCMLPGPTDKDVSPRCMPGHAVGAQLRQKRDNKAGSYAPAKPRLAGAGTGSSAAKFMY
jgi:hypothetical protein